MIADPARAFKPKDKPRVERAMPYVRDSFWRGREFPSLQQMQAAAITWCQQVATVRSHRSWTAPARCRCSTPPKQRAETVAAQ